jgi:hypothetical protein
MSQHFRSTPIAEIRQRGRYVRSVPWGPEASLECRRVRHFLALARVVFFVPELARVARCKVASVFAAGLVFLADILPFCALGFGTVKAGFGV